MKLNQSLSWKFLLPIGAVVWVLFYGGVFQLIGTIMVVMGFVDLVRWYKNKKKDKYFANKPIDKQTSEWQGGVNYKPDKVGMYIVASFSRSNTVLTSSTTSFRCSCKSLILPILDPKLFRSPPKVKGIAGGRWDSVETRGDDPEINPD